MSLRGSLQSILVAAVLYNAAFQQPAKPPSRLEQNLAAYASEPVAMGYSRNGTQYLLPAALYPIRLAELAIVYAPAYKMGTLLGFTFPEANYRLAVINEALSPQLRRETVQHEIMHHLVRASGAHAGLTHAQEENLTRRAAWAQMGPDAVLHPALGFVPE